MRGRAKWESPLALTGASGRGAAGSYRMLLLHAKPAVADRKHPIRIVLRDLKELL